ncbi:cytidylyltransferase domain-containing protein [Clostridium tyrobutyricum]|uniref:acylneuraminate cytidylyltransferase family protein n=1 Tax=Clostridium tyrobutyricum TaxID=1519 RepID=UPI0010AA2618|nr:acylneuraminate cytidylyltransferase family protein [Clostridium tyrobutyricum]QCH26957.1 CMP-N,N'-diacetyllegionaminic acid synthase [Clostridium tyrobutyricum]
MINNKKILAIIPARGGSKGVPHKNIKEINDRPLISYTIEEAINSRYIDKLIVSTEDKSIAEISRKYGAEVPFLRPRELALDETPGIDPILHAVKCLKDKGCNFDYVMCLQCTSPFRKYYQIDESIKSLYDEDADSIVSVCESEITPYWMKKIKDGRLKNFMDESIFYARRQDIPKTYRLNGAIYLAKTGILLDIKNWYTENTLPYVMDEISSIDIDNMIDFKFAEFLMKETNNAR